MYADIPSLLTKFNVYPKHREDCLQELYLAWLEGKRSEEELRNVVYDYLYKQRRGIPTDKLYHVPVFDHYPHEQEEEEQTIIRFLSTAYRNGHITKIQTMYIYLWTLGDTDQMIAEHFGRDRSSVYRNRMAGIRRLRKLLA